MVTGRVPSTRQLIAEVGDVAHDVPTFLTSPLYRRWHLHWGATAAETAEALPGDDLTSHAQFRATRAITIAAPPALVWPWLVQAGALRAGWYSNDLLDNLGHPSETVIVPELEHLEVGPDVRVWAISGVRVRFLSRHHEASKCPVRRRIPDGP